VLKLIRIALAVLFLLGSTSAESASGAELTGERIRAELDSLLGQRASALQRRDSFQKQADELAAEVARLKGSLAERFSRLEQYRLEGTLSRSQAVADSIDMLNNSISAYTDKLTALSIQATAYYTSVLDSMTLELKDIRDRKLRREIMEKIERLQEERAILARFSTAAGVRKPREAGFSLSQLAQAVQVLPQDSPEEIREKADFLTDMAARWSRTLAKLEKNIERLSEEKAIRMRLGEFAQEISLFDETGPSSRAGLKSSSTSPTDNGMPTENVLDRQGYGDFSIEKLDETFQPGQLSFDLELGELESGMWLLENLENISAGELETAVGLLEARRDSLEENLDILRAMERKMRSKAGEIEREQEGAPPK
jgi:hypothetical protein